MGGFVGRGAGAVVPHPGAAARAGRGRGALDREPAAGSRCWRWRGCGRRAPPGLGARGPLGGDAPAGAAARAADWSSRYPERLSPALDLRARPQGTGAPGFIPALEALLDHSYRDQLPRIEIPVLVVWGRNDMLVPRGDAREYVELIGDNARREMFEDTGHLPMIERPTRFNALLAGFLRRRARAQRRQRRPCPPEPDDSTLSA